MIYIMIDSEPPILYYQGIDASYAPDVSIRYPLLKEVGRVSRSLNDEVPNLTVSLDNQSGELTDSFSDPPVGCKLALYKEATVIFSGTIDGVKISDTVDLSIVS